MEFTVVYLAMLFIYIFVDFIWITLFMQPYFTANLGHLLRESVGTSFLLTYGAIFFVFYVLGSLLVRSASWRVASNSAITASLSGAFFRFSF